MQKTCLFTNGNKLEANVSVSGSVSEQGAETTLHKETEIFF